jgi:farnesyl-diphosphate farnesyltransferase
MESLLESPVTRGATAFARKWSAREPTNHPFYQELLGETPFILNELMRREVPIQQLVRDHARRTALGMASFLGEGTIQLRSLADLQRYCYFVAGVVGEMLTEMFAHRIPGFAVTRAVRSEAQAFAEGLQLTNILKDSDEDVRHGRVMLPEDVERGSLFDVARQDLLLGQQYVDRLSQVRAAQGYVAFTELPLLLAIETLNHIERSGPGSKVPRDEVARILARVTNKTSDQDEAQRRDVYNACTESGST